MDTGNGKFITANSNEELLKKALREKIENGEKRLEDKDGVFHEGEQLVIRNSKFKIQGIRPNGKMILKLLRKENK